MTSHQAEPLSTTVHEHSGPVAVHVFGNAGLLIVEHSPESWDGMEQAWDNAVRWLWQHGYALTQDEPVASTRLAEVYVVRKRPNA